MNATPDTSEIPRDFGWRFVAWYLWSNAITILSTLQGALAAVLLLADGSNPPLLAHQTVRAIILGNAVLTAVLANIKRSSPPPTKVSP